MEKGFRDVLDELKNGEMEVAGKIGHVTYYMIEKTGYSFHFYAVHEHNDKEALSEVLYDLRNKDYFIKRNGRDVRFNIPNLDLVVPRRREWSHAVFNQGESVQAFFDMVSVEDNKGMYQTMLSAIGSLGEERVSMTSRALIRLITKYNKLELLYKAGLDVSKPSYELRYLIKEATEKDVRKLHEVFGLTKAQYKFMTEHGMTGNNLIDNAKEMAWLTQKDMDDYRGYVTHVKNLEEKYFSDERLKAFMNVASVTSYIEQLYRHKSKKGTVSDWTFWGYVFQREHINIHRLLEYLLFECYFSQGLDFRKAFDEYKDYYRMSMDLGCERFDKYPRYLRTMHDIVARNYNSALDTDTINLFNKQVERYQNLATDRLNGYKVILPKEPKDIITEGNSLQHCVASYVRRVAQGKSIIVFLREKDEVDASLVTVEIMDNRIVQARGFGNRTPAEEEKKALQMFSKRHDLEKPNYI
ncbi:UNVERIFIED_ORG: hypothetical protein Xoosp15_131 [Xanthomonas phage Xoo-sp15]